MADESKFLWSYTYNAIIKDFESQPESFKECLDYYEKSEGAQLLNDIKYWLERKPVSKVYFIGNSYSYYATSVAKYCFMKAKNCLPYSCESFKLTEFFDYILPQEQQPNSLYIFITQSGNSTLVRESIHQLNLINVKKEFIWMVTNNPTATSIENGEVGHVFPIKVNSEIVLGSKSYQNTVLVLFFIAKILSHAEIPQEDILQMTHSLHHNLQSFVSNWRSTVDKIMPFLGNDFQYMYLIARDPISLGTANSWALSAKTFTQMFAEGISLGLFFHGSFQIFDRTHKNGQVRCIVLVGDNTSMKSDKVLERLIEQINHRAGKVIILSNNPLVGEKFEDNDRILFIPFNSIRTEFASIFEAYILQMVLLQIAVDRGLIPIGSEE